MAEECLRARMHELEALDQLMENDSIESYYRGELFMRLQQ